MCIGQWGVDWAIQSVLQRDRKHEPRRVGNESSEVAATVKKKKKRVQAGDSEDSMPRKKGNSRRHQRPIPPRLVNHDERSSLHDAYSKDEDSDKYESNARRHLLPSDEEENSDLDLPGDFGKCSDAPDAGELGREPYSISRDHLHDKGKSKARKTTKHVPHDSHDVESDVDRNRSTGKKRKVTEEDEHDFKVQDISPVSKKHREGVSPGERKGKNISFRRQQLRPTRATKKKQTYRKNGRRNRKPAMSFDDDGNTSGDDNERETDESEYSGSDTDEDDSAVDEVSSPVPRRKKE